MADVFASALVGGVLFAALLESSFACGGGALLLAGAALSGGGGGASGLFCNGGGGNASAGVFGVFWLTNDWKKSFAGGWLDRASRNGAA